MTAITLTVNGATVSADIEPRTHLADFLREQLLLTGTHLGCEHGICGACTVLIDGAPARACLTLAVMADGCEIVTVEGFGDDPLALELREAFSAHHALQCGYCTPGMLISAYDVARRLPGADAPRVRVEMSGNLCRCTGYVGIVAAVVDVAGKVARGEVPAPARPVARRDWTPPTLVGAAPKIAPIAAAAVPAAARVAVPDDLGADAVRIEERVRVAHPPETVWALLADPAKVVGCVPGATLVASDGRTIEAEMTVKLGPISARFAGQGEIVRDDAARRGVLTGSGADTKSASRAIGRATYAVVPEGAGTRLDIAVEYALTGPLAQFARAGIARDLAARLTRAFAHNLEAVLSGTGAVTTELRAGALVWTMLRDWMRRLFGR